MVKVLVNVVVVAFMEGDEGSTVGGKEMETADVTIPEETFVALLKKGGNKAGYLYLRMTR